MKLLFKQRMFSWLDSYDIYDENGNTMFVVKGKLAWGHCLKIFDAQGREIGMVKERVLTFLPKFEIYLGNACVGTISKEFTLFTSAYNIDYNGWYIAGDFFEWNYQIQNRAGACVAVVKKELFNWTDTYSITVANPQDALCALMVVLAIDAEKCTRENAQR